MGTLCRKASWPVLPGQNSFFSGQACVTIYITPENQAERSSHYAH